MISPRQRSLLQTLWRFGKLSRWELHERTGIRPNTIGSDTAELLDAGILRESGPRSMGRGRPRVPLEINPDDRNVVGLAIRPGLVEVGRMNLLGELLDAPKSQRAPQGPAAMDAALELLREKTDEHTLLVSISTPGLVDPAENTILFSSVMPEGGRVSLNPLREVASGLTMILENDMHALAARWMLTQQAEPEEDVLLVYFEDGALGAAMLIDGRPNRGCVLGANELGHTRLPVETDRCYCGQIGCLERICSSSFLARHGGGKPLPIQVAEFTPTDEALGRIIELFSIGLSNAVNLTRVNRLVLVSEMMQHEPFAEALESTVRDRMLGELTHRVKIERWIQPAARAAETAGWLGLAYLYYEGWNRTQQVTNEMPEIQGDTDY